MEIRKNSLVVKLCLASSFSHFSFHFVISRDRPVYTFGTSLTEFIKKKAEEDATFSSEESSFLSCLLTNRNINILLRLTDYLNHQLNHAKNKDYFAESSLPAPREDTAPFLSSFLVREFYDRLNPTLLPSDQSSYKGCVLLAHPALVLLDAVCPEREGFENAHYPAFLVLHFIQFFLEILAGSSAERVSRSPPHGVDHRHSIDRSVFPDSRELFESKHSLIKHAVQLQHQEIPSKPGNSQMGSRRRVSVLPPELETEMRGNNVETENPMRPMRSFEAWKQWDAVYDRYSSQHPIFGEMEENSNRIVLASLRNVSESTRNGVEFVEESNGLMATDEYERVCLDLSRSCGTMKNIPMCVASLSLYSYPFHPMVHVIIIIHSIINMEMSSILK